MSIMAPPKKRGRPRKTATQDQVVSNGVGQQNNMPVQRTTINHRHQQNYDAVTNNTNNIGHQYNTQERNGLERQMKLIWEYILGVRKLVEQYTSQNMNIDQVVEHLRDVNGVDPQLTLQVWKTMVMYNTRNGSQRKNLPEANRCIAQRRVEIEVGRSAEEGTQNQLESNNGQPNKRPQMTNNVTMPYNTNNGGQQNYAPMTNNTNYGGQQNYKPMTNNTNYGGQQYTAYERNQFLQCTGLHLEYVMLIKELIYQCMLRYMHRDLVVDCLQVERGVDPRLTCFVWELVEEANPELFRHYYTRLVLCDQICTFNRLLHEHAELAEKLQILSPVPPPEEIAWNSLNVPLNGNNMPGGPPPAVHTNGNKSDDSGISESVGIITYSHNISPSGMDTSEGPTGNGMRSSEEVLQLTGSHNISPAGMNTSEGPTHNGMISSDEVLPVTASHNISPVGIVTSEGLAGIGMRSSKEVLQLMGSQNISPVGLDTSDNGMRSFEEVLQLNGSHDISAAGMDTSEGPAVNGMRSFEEVLQLPALTSLDSKTTDKLLDWLDIDVEVSKSDVGSPNSGIGYDPPLRKCDSF